MKIAACLLCLLSSLAAAQPTKCNINGKITYTDGPCPSGATQQRAAPAATPTFPRVEPGLWKVKRETGSEHEVCGDPFEQWADGVAQSRQLGCTVQFTSPAPRTTKLLVDCPASRGDGNGRNVHKGRGEMTFVLSSPVGFTLEVKSLDGQREYATFTRAGGC
jgi:hypothetical protein